MSDQDKYKYEAMSNQVLRPDRKLLSNRTDPLRDAALSAPTSMAGKVNMKEMGSRARIEEEEVSVAKSVTEKLKRQQLKKASTITRPGNSTLLDSDMENLKYHPRSHDSVDAYEELVSWVSRMFGSDISHSMVLSATDILLSTLMTETLTDRAKHKIISEDLGVTIPDNEFATAIRISSKITDYQDQTKERDQAEEVMALDLAGDEDGEEGEEDSDDDTDSDDDFAGPRLDDFVQAPEDEDDSPQDQEEVFKLDTRHSETQQISLADVDSLYLQRTIASAMPKLDAVALQDITNQVFELLSSNLNDREFEQRVLGLLTNTPELAKLLISNRTAIFWGTRLANASNDAERLQVQEEMLQSGAKHLLEEDSQGPSKKRKLISNDSNAVTTIRKPKIVNLDDLVFDQGSHLMSTTKVSLPSSSFKRVKKHYEEIHIPAPAPPSEEAQLVPISTLPTWAQAAFLSAETATLNRVQSKVYPTAFEDDENILLCAPTGAGKTNVAMLTVLRAMSHFRLEDGSFALNDFKIVYIAPLKALVQEQVREFSRRLSQFSIKVEELTGDSNLTKQQISETQILVTTPEKWDVITRKNSDTSYTNLVSLLIIDEIHLLHDERGPVLESIVARTIRNTEFTSRDVRLVGLSATLPNYKDVARFLRVDDSKGLFYFDASYRPCPLAQQFIGITEKNSFKKINALNEACYDKILEAAGKYQVIIFVHSRKDTAKTAKWLRDKLLEEKKLNLFLKSDAGNVEILRQESEKVQSDDLRDLLPTGFAIHHAGLSRGDRSASEDLFAQGKVQVLVSTATLAWGVNLPAHTVIIKGTEVYAPDKGNWTQLSPQDILQMLGRAGRPRYDESGEGIIITSQSEVQYYLAVLNQQLPIESQLMSKLADNLNAEIVAGSVKSLEDGVEWLGYTYLYVRMLKSPAVYRVGAEYLDDKSLSWKRTDLIHSALTILHQNNLVIYDVETGRVKNTDLGRISSHYYINYDSMAFYNKQLKSYSSIIDVFRIFASSSEFKLIPVRQEEKIEITKLIERAPVPIKEDVNDPRAKANVLLQSYISRLSLDGFALNADMVYITQSAGRLLRAIYEIVLQKQWAGLTKLLLDLCKMVERRIWLSNSPFRQFPDCPSKIIKNTESSNLPWSQYFNLSDTSEMSQAIRDDSSARKALEMVKKFPKLELKCSIQTITPSLLRFELDILPVWEWDAHLHNNAEQFLLLVEDTNGEKILYSDSFLVRRNYINTEHLIDFTVPMTTPMPPNYFVTLISEKWLHCEYRIPVMFNSIKIPKQFAAPREWLDLSPVPVSDLGVEEFSNALAIEYFNKFQTQVLNSLYNSNDNVFIGAVKGSGKTICAELALFNHWKQNKGRAVYVVPTQEKLNVVHKDWQNRFGEIAGGKTIGKFTNELSANLKILAESHVVLATPHQFDVVSRRWKQRRNVQSIELMIFDDAQTIGNGLDGCVYENVISRMRFMSSQVNEMRIIALGSSIASGGDLGKWIGASKNNIYNFSSVDRVNPLEVHLQSFAISHNPSMILAMIKPAFLAVKGFEGRCTVFVPSRMHCIDIGLEFSRLASMDGDSLLNVDVEDIKERLSKVSDASLKNLLESGIGFYYKDMNKRDRNIVERLDSSGCLGVVFATRDTCSFVPSCDLVIVLSTQFFEGKEHRYVDYAINEVLEMVGCSSSQALLLTNASKRGYYKKFLNEPLPVESYLNVFLTDAFISEISTGLIDTRQDCINWLTFTFFYRRLLNNPSFYGVQDVSQVGLSGYLTELVEVGLNELCDAKLIELGDDEEDEIGALDGALIASYYNVSFVTMQTFMLSLSKKSKLKSILEIVSSASEFDSIPMRKKESSILQKIYNRVPVKSSQGSDSPYWKVFVLLQAHFCRLSLPPDLASDQKLILSKIIKLLYAIVDILSSEGHMNCTYAMDLCQMVIRSLWDTDSCLRQIPHFNDDVIERCISKGIQTPFAIAELDELEVFDLLQMSESQTNAVAQFVNDMPMVELSYEFGELPIVANESSVVNVLVSRDDVPDLSIKSAFYPFEHVESWWVVIGDKTTRELYGIKRVVLDKEENRVKLEFSVPRAGHHELCIWCVCDSYVECDKEIEVDVDVKED